MCGGWTRGGRDPDEGVYRGSLELTVELEAWTESRGAGVMWAQLVFRVPGEESQLYYRL